jgi:inosine-uridine nucleoside N-ribohydrolase
MPRKLIIDTDPGVDDILALALAFLSPPNDIEISLITPVFGNTSLFHTVRNTVTFLTIIDKEREWRSKNGYRAPRSETPVVAMGADGPIDGSKVIDAKHFHGKDGIGEVHTTVSPPLWGLRGLSCSIRILRPRIIVGRVCWMIRRDILCRRRGMRI